MYLATAMAAAEECKSGDLHSLSSIFLNSARLLEPSRSPLQHLVLRNDPVKNARDYHKGDIVSYLFHPREDGYWRQHLRPHFDFRWESLYPVSDNATGPSADRWVGLPRYPASISMPHKKNHPLLPLHRLCLR